MYWELDCVAHRVTFRLLNKLSYGNEKTDTSSQHIEPAEEAREKSQLKGRGGDNVLLLFYFGAGKLFYYRYRVASVVERGFCFIGNARCCCRSIHFFSRFRFK